MIIKETYPRNLKLTSEFNLQQAASKEPESEASSSDKGPAKHPHVPDHIKGDSKDSWVVVLKSFKELISDQDKNVKLMYLKSRIGVSLQALCDSLPTYNNNDFVVVARKNEKGLWKTRFGRRGPSSPLRSNLDLSPRSSRTHTSWPLPMLSWTCLRMAGVLTPRTKYWPLMVVAGT